MTATLEHQVAELRRANAELQQRLDEALAQREESETQKAAMAQIVEAINASRSDPAPVFDTILEKATGVCDAAFGIMWTLDNDVARVRAMRNVPHRFVEYLMREPPVIGPDTLFGRAIIDRSLIHIADCAVGEVYQKRAPLAVAAVELGGTRSLMMVPLVKEEAVFGILAIYRQEVRPFSDREIALVRNFAGQAVIAIENARLITETRQALEQQTATAEVLQVINSSPGDLTPVFDAMLEKATRLCEATCGQLATYDGEFFHFVAVHGSQEFADFLSKNPSIGPPGSDIGRLIAGEDVVHRTDFGLEALPATAHARAFAELAGAKTSFMVALRKDSLLLGAVTVYRQEARPFTDKQIALLKNFAAQAVIAIENARLLTETREALEQQTATAEVLGVINSSPGNLQPVFEAILEKAHSLCGVAFGSLQLFDGDKFRAVATRNLPAALTDRLREGYSPGQNMPNRRLLAQ